MNLFPLSPKEDDHTCPTLLTGLFLGSKEENTLKCIVKALPSRECVCVWGIIITTNPSSITMARKIPRYSEKGKTFVFCFTHNFLHTVLVGGPSSQPVGVLISPIIFRKKWMQYSLPSACLKLGANTVPCNHVLAGVAVFLLGKRHGTRWTLNADKFSTWTLVCFKPLGAEPVTQEVLSECSVAELCSKLWDHFILGPVPAYLELGRGAPREGRLQKPFCIIKSQKTSTGPLLWSDWGNWLENVPNTSWDTAEMAAEHAKWPAPSFFKHFKKYICTLFNSCTKISFSFPQAQISGSREHSYQEIIWSPEFQEALSCASCLPSVLGGVIISQ